MIQYTPLTLLSLLVSRHQSPNDFNPTQHKQHTRTVMQIWICLCRLLLIHSIKEDTTLTNALL